MKKALRDLVKERMREALAVAYYHFTDGCNEEYNNLSEAEQKQVLELVDQYGKRMCKAIGTTYFTA